MLNALKRLWWGLRLRRALQRQRAVTRQLAAGNPVEARLTELCIEADDSGIETLTARQQLVVRTWSARGVIGNGGFRYVLEGTQPLAPVAEGFRALGFPGAAAACESVMAAVASAPALGEQARREAALAARGDDAFGSEDGAVYEVEWEALEAAIGLYMRSHPRDFPGLPPHHDPSADDAKRPRESQP